MSLITRMMRQVAVYWAPAGNDLYNADTFASPIEIACRWEGSASEVIGPSGETVVADAVAYVDRDLEPGGILALKDGTQHSHAPSVSTRQRIVAFKTIPNLKATETLRAAYVGKGG